MDLTGPLTRRFPLVARTRPACGPLTRRIGEVCELARAATEPGAAGLPMAAAAHNKAALIASDCGIPDLARSLCWRRHSVYRRIQPLDGQAARHALEPLINLARLLIRDGHGEEAYQLLDALYQAVAARGNAVIDDRKVSFHNFTVSDADHRTVREWLWTVLLADGTRALAGAGRWGEALAHAERYNGVGRRLLDGRQIAILTRCLTGDAKAASTLVEESVVAEPWEQAVASCLAVLCLAAGDRPAGVATAAMVERYLASGTEPGLAVFRTRLGLSVVDLACGVQQPDAARVAAHLVQEAVAAGDGYVARDVLAHAGCRAVLSAAQEQALVVAVEASGLERGIPEDLLAVLMAAVQASEKVTAHNLTTSVPATPPR